tara:strand:- start:3191 stop:3679 length:489 start_codon:yes stop_codon:yes gene_type:complete
MTKRLDLVKEVFSKTEYIKTINTSFNELGNITVTEEIQTQPTVEEFFGLYNSLFYDIQALGETNSHEYLVKTSGEYINFNEINDEIQALQAEISQLRSDLLSAQIENVKLTASPLGDESTNKTLNTLEKELQIANNNLVETNISLSENVNASTNSPSVFIDG